MWLGCHFTTLHFSRFNREEKDRALAYKRKGLRPRQVVLRVWFHLNFFIFFFTAVSVMFK